MREIKFRQWYMDSWAYVGFYKESSDSHYHLKGFPSCHIDRYPVYQFTGLQVKGVDLYEGDVVKICDGSINGMPWFRDDLIVKFENGRFNLPLWFMSGDIDSTHWATIIGNIHENKDLLK